MEARPEDEPLYHLVVDGMVQQYHHERPGVVLSTRIHRAWLYFLFHGWYVSAVVLRRVASQ